MRKFIVFRPSKYHMILLGGLLTFSEIKAQETFPINGVNEPKNAVYALVHATIVKDEKNTISNGTMIIKDGKILSVGPDGGLPKEAIVVDCKGKYIYPSFIDIYTDYGVAAPARTTGGAAGFGGGGFGGQAQLTSNTKGPYGWNQTIHPEAEAYKIFDANEATAKGLRDVGFGTVLSHAKDGIARGTGTIVTLADNPAQLVILKERASAHFSLFKGTSSQSYPSSMMGVIALLRQTYLDAQWYKTKPEKEGVNLTLQAMLDNQSLPQIIESNDKWNDMRSDRIGDEFGVQYIIKGGGNEFQRIKEIASTKATYILNLNFPTATDIEDPADARMVSLSDMKNWEMQPMNLGAMEKAKIPFCITSADLRTPGQFLTNLRKAIEYGLSETAAMEALTKTPATLLGIADKVGSLEAGKLANFLITSGPIFNDRTVIYQNWVQGTKYVVAEMGWSEYKGIYKLVINYPTGAKEYKLDVKSGSAANLISTDTIATRFSYNGKLVNMSFGTARVRGGGGVAGGFGGGRGGAGGGAAAPTGPTTRLSGVASAGTDWSGTGEDTAGVRFSWTATYTATGVPAPDTTTRRRTALRLGKVTFPFDGYGFEEMPVAENMLIKNATVWTNEKEGVLQNADVLVKNGKIVQIGKNLTDASAKVIDGTGKHVTPGIIDEHSHIAAASINEGAQSVTSEVRIADNLNPEDINIYRQLSGGVTTSHILHGSANSIGGQTQLIKLRWGGNDDDLKFKNSDGFIKFALGENVKRTTSQNNTRFPDTRMGVEEVFVDAFSRAKDYEAAMKAYEVESKKKGSTAKPVRRDLELDALVEIMNNKRFITCHSYVQSEITALLRVADKMGFKVNTFTHILEGYKVADKMLAHGANASTFSDWWAYKLEVQDAIPYNAAIMTRVGLNVCINSDDAEMARRLNQEAAKSIKYGGLTEEEALKMVTLNPAKALHVADRVGSLKPGKDADLVIWSDNPLTIYAKAEKTIVDGTVFYDMARDLELRKSIAAERSRLTQKLIAEKRSGAPTVAATPTQHSALTCGDHEHHRGLFDVDEVEEASNENQ